MRQLSGKVPFSRGKGFFTLAGFGGLSKKAYFSPKVLFILLDTAPF